jgi:hypothetical protein
MDLRFYIPISKYLKPTDAQPENVNDTFCFSIIREGYPPTDFKGYKSLACFLSTKALNQLISKKNSLVLKYLSNQLSPAQLRDEFLNLLSGKPIVVDQNNFDVFNQVFRFLRNRDFELFFNNKIPTCPTEFYLSIHSLKNANFSIIESTLQEV